MRNKFIYIYYFVLILVLALYTNMSHSPNMLIRLGYLAALVLPLVHRKELVPAVIICALGISDNTFAYPFMPTEMFYYVVLALGFAFLSLHRRDYCSEINPLFVIALLYVVLNDIIMQGKLSPMVSVFLICISFYLCMEDEIEIDSQFLSLAFILISLTISYWALFCSDAQINSYNKVEDIEQTGWTDPNYLSVALGAGLVVAVKDLLKGGNKLVYTIVLILTVIGATVAMLQLASRGIILAVVLAVVALFALSKTSSWVKIIVVIAAALFLVFLYTNQYMEFVLARFEMDDGTGSNRTEIWASKLTDFFNKKNPLNWIFGVGQEEGYRLGKYFGLSVNGISTHNDFISVIVYYGFAGAALFFSVIAYPLRICQKSDRPQILALLVYLLMCSMSIEPMAHGNFVYWGFFFYIMVLARQSQVLEFVEDEEDEDEDEDEDQD